MALLSLDLAREQRASALGQMPPRGLLALAEETENRFLAEWTMGPEGEGLVHREAAADVCSA